MSCKPDRCSGHCCKFFTLSKSWKQVRRLKRQRIMDGTFDFSDPVWEETFYVMDMLIPVGRGRDGTERFTCTHLSKDGQCMDYEKRPGMCREFGVVESNPCIFIGACTWRSGLHGDPNKVQAKKEKINGSKESKAPATAEKAGAAS